MKKIIYIVVTMMLFIGMNSNSRAGWFQEPGRLWNETVSGKKNHVAGAVKDVGQKIQHCGVQATITVGAITVCEASLAASPTGAAIAVAASTCGLSVEQAGKLMECN